MVSILDKGIVYYHFGNYAEDITYYDQALSIDPTVVFAWYDK
jgi:tetratricopeptide (TPR) repeat protein